MRMKECKPVFRQPTTRYTTKFVQGGYRWHTTSKPSVKRSTKSFKP